MFDREKLVFEYFFNAGLDKVTCQCDVEGSDVYELDDVGNEHYIGSINWKTPADISQMNDDEVEELLIENGIIY